MAVTLQSKREKPRLRLYAPREDYSPIAAINTTPLIDMMLVLLIMFIMAIPLSTHKVPLDLPPPVPGPVDTRPVHRLDIDLGGRAIWNGRPVTDDELRQRLTAAAADPAGPALHFNPHSEARYERVDQILADVRRAGIDRLGLVDSERYATAIDR
ncbi:biopolymer transporter ExbD [Sphingosinicella sp. LHD-64]|uniref:ExbD/TolR family protein n=1 Tax=Sphingosinicella sp. LHD-64 TaxID=3072139 RepID=UPI00280D51C8|nr:biopolymer transporter ExbD [Sphingosinicella sp. LHD-64]MDQ8756966.1 biopolymer transporter ExbD [Sphingosinicella sp. LHD-64]